MVKFISVTTITVISSMFEDVDISLCRHFRRVRIRSTIRVLSKFDSDQHSIDYNERILVVDFLLVCQMVVTYSPLKVDFRIREASQGA